MRHGLESAGVGAGWAAPAEPARSGTTSPSLIVANVAQLVERPFGSVVLRGSRLMHGRLRVRFPSFVLRVCQKQKRIEACAQRDRLSRLMWIE